MLRIEDHTADIKLVISGDLNTIVKELVGYVLRVPEGKSRGESFIIHIDEEYPDLFFVQLVNSIIAELEIRSVRPISYTITDLKEFKCKLEIFYEPGQWSTNIKAATYWDLKYENNRLEIVLDI
ncbi:MAG: hypothetical protein QXI75_01605 [Candidatus Anstonellales archaeon]